MQSTQTKTKQTKKGGCDCLACQECCQREPGWFLPEEIPLAAAFLGLSEKAFIATRCTAHMSDGTTVLAPTTKPHSTTCIFFVGGRCAIHEVKPYECRKVFGCDPARRHQRIREFIIRKW